MATRIIHIASNGNTTARTTVKLNGTQQTITGETITKEGTRGAFPTKKACVALDAALMLAGIPKATLAKIVWTDIQEQEAKAESEATANNSMTVEFVDDNAACEPANVTPAVQIVLATQPAPAFKPNFANAIKLADRLEAEERELKAADATPYNPQDIERPMLPTIDNNIVTPWSNRAAWIAKANQAIGQVIAMGGELNPGQFRQDVNALMLHDGFLGAYNQGPNGQSIVLNFAGEIADPTRSPVVAREVTRTDSINKRKGVVPLVNTVQGAAVIAKPAKKEKPVRIEFKKEWLKNGNMHKAQAVAMLGQAKCDALDVAGMTTGKSGFHRQAAFYIGLCAASRTDGVVLEFQENILKLHGIELVSAEGGQVGLSVKAA